MAIGFLYNDKDYKYPKGCLFYDQDEYDQALAEGWDTGPVDKAKAAREKTEGKIPPNEWEIEEPEMEEEPKPKPKPKSRRRKK